jgi:alpha-glucosidase
MVADYPSAYRGHPGLPILAAIPTTWDDTRVLDAKVGEFIVIARRSEAVWYVGAMTDRRKRVLEVPLDFLGIGKYQAVIVSDDEPAKYGMSIRRQPVSASDTVTLKLSPGGGALMRVDPD